METDAGVAMSCIPMGGSEGRGGGTDVGTAGARGRAQSVKWALAS